LIGGTLPSRFDQLHANKLQLEEGIAQAEARLADISVRYPQNIKQLQAQADVLAKEFKALIPQAADAYASGAGAAAKSISNERKAKQAQCEALNAQAAALRQNLADLRGWLKERRRELQQVTEVVATQLRNDTTKNIHVAGFSRAYGVSQWVVREELGVLPQAVLARIKSVSYIGELQSDGAVGRTGNKADYPEQTVINLYINPSSFKKEILEEGYRQTIIHEAGHVLFDWVMTTEQRWKWGELYKQTLMNKGGAFVSDYARKSLREDFGECFALFVHNPKKLHKRDNARYTFIKNIYEEIAR
jgi:hypothetical protein